MMKILILIFSFSLFYSSIFAQTDRWRLIWTKNDTSEHVNHYLIYKSISTPIPNNYSEPPDYTVQHIDPQTQADTLMEFIDDNLPIGELVYYRLKAENNFGISDFSEQVSACIPEILIPPILYLLPNSQVNLDLDTLVNDLDNPVGQFEWQVSSDNNIFTFNPSNNILTLDIPNYDGIVDIITFQVTDTSEFFDQKDVIIYSSTETNHAPYIFNNIEDQTIQPGSNFSPIELNNYVYDPESADDQLSWAYTVRGDLIFSISIDNIDEGWWATISNPNNLVGTDTITFRVSDPEGLFDEDEAVFTVEAIPQLLDIPDQSIKTGQSFSDINLDSYLTYDGFIGKLLWTYYPQSQYLDIYINQNHIASISYDSDWLGVENIVFLATDTTTGLSDNDAVQFRVTSDSVKVDQEKIFAFPVPFRTSQGSSHITFRNLPIGGKLIIYDLLGYPVYETDITTTEHPWRTTNQHGKWVRSGVYLYIVKDEHGKKVKSDKVIIIR